MTKFSVLWLYDIKICKYSAELLSPVLILQSEWIWLILSVWLDFMFREEGCLLCNGHFLKPPTNAAYRGQWQVGRSHIWELLFAFQQGKESSTAFCCIYCHWYCISAKPREAAVSHPPTLHSSKALWATPEDRLCLNTSALPCFHFQRRKGTPCSLSLQIKSPQAFCA